MATRSRGAAQGGAAQARQARVTAAVAERDGRRGGPQGLFVRRRGDLGVRARSWKAGAIGAGDLGFGCAGKTKLAGGAHGSAAAALAEAAEAGADRWGPGVGERGGHGAATASVLGRASAGAGEGRAAVAQSRPGWSGPVACGGAGRVARGRPGRLAGCSWASALARAKGRQACGVGRAWGVGAGLR